MSSHSPVVLKSLFVPHRHRLPGEVEACNINTNATTNINNKITRRGLGEQQFVIPLTDSQDW